MASAQPKFIKTHQIVDTQPFVGNNAVFCQNCQKKANAWACSQELLLSKTEGFLLGFFHHGSMSYCCLK